MCADDDDEVFESEEPAAGNDDSTKRRSQSLSSLNPAQAGADKVWKHILLIFL